MHSGHTKVLLASQHYFPSVYWFALLTKHEALCLEAHESFQKQTCRNRCYILTANKVDRLTVPVKSANSHLPIREVVIDYRQKWQNRHWRAIQSAYGKAPFFEFYADYFREVLYGNTITLFDLNQQILSLCLKILGIAPKISYTTGFKTHYPDNFTDLRGAFDAEDMPGTIRAIPYGQLFGDGFEHNLSILDLLFNLGTEALPLLKKQAAAMDT